MGDEVRSVFDRALGRLQVPAGDLGAVVGRGRRRRTRRAAAGLAVSAVAVAAAWAFAANLPTDGTGPRPAGPGADRRDVLLVSQDHLGPKPGPGLARERDREEARAVTVAFHALIHRLPYYDFDYHGVGRSKGAWKVTFLEASEKDLLEDALEDQLEVLEREMRSLAEKQARLQTLRRRGERERDRLANMRGKERARHLARHVAQTEAAIVELEAQVRQVGRARAAVQERLESRPDTGGRPGIVLRVVLAEGELVVDRVRGRTERGALEAVVGYGQRVQAVDAWGADYFDPRFERTADGLVARVRKFWTGPIPASYEETCVPEVRDESDALVWRGEEPFGRYEGDPGTEDRRDGEVISFRVGYAGPTTGLQLEVECIWRRAS